MLRARRAQCSGTGEISRNGCRTGRRNDSERLTGLRVQGGRWANVSAVAAANFEVGMNFHSFGTMPPSAAYAIGANAGPYLLTHCFRQR